jgi:hypothetical protein
VRFGLLGCGYRVPPALIERSEIAQQRSGVGPARAQFLFH